MKTILLIIYVALAAAVLFAVAGSAAWWNAWTFFVFMTVLGGGTSRLIKNTPGLAEEQRNAAEKAKTWYLRMERLPSITVCPYFLDFFVYN